LTHGPIAWGLLPLILWGAMLWFDAWQTRRGKRPESRLPLQKGWLLALAYIGTLSHPLFDWFNSYGIRLFEPFTSTWFFGDTLFIVDVWIWAALVAGVWMSLRRERNGKMNWQRPAKLGFAAVCTYVFVNGLITAQAEASAITKLRARYDISVSMPDPVVVANPVPIAFWRREILWRDEANFGSGFYGLNSGLSLDLTGRPHGMSTSVKTDVESQVIAAKPFLFWSRMPIAYESGDSVWIGDQRFANPLMGDRFRVKVKDVK
jgi:inner membrane protein